VPDLSIRESEPRLAKGSDLAQGSGSPTVIVWLVASAYAPQPFGPRAPVRLPPNE